MSETTAADARAIASGAMMLGRALNHPKNFERIARESGTTLDKVSEITMNCVRERQDLRLSDIATRLGVELSSVSRKVAKLEEAGLLVRRSDPNDARVSRLHLTEAGEQELTKLNNARCEHTAQVLDGWTTTDREQFRHLLERFITDLNRHLGEN